MAFLDYTGLSYFLVKLHNIFASKKSVEDINDETTGINLIRGSRDFRVGVESANVRDASLKSDGWYIGNTGTVHTDEEGYGVLDLNITGTAGIIATNVIPNEVVSGKNVTVSFEVMFTERPEVDVALIQFLSGDSVSSSNDTLIYAVNINDLGYAPSSVPVGKWIKGVKTVKIGELSDNKYFRVSVFRNSYSKASSFRKVKLELGAINNPIWSPSPFDIDYINDETTGINLCKGAKDFTVGTDRNINNSVVFNDGFTVPHAEISKYVDKDGFTVLYGKSTAMRSIYCSAINSFNIGEIFTISFDYKLNEEVSSNSRIAHCAAYNGSSALVVSDFTAKPNDEVGVWKRGQFTYTVPSTINEQIGLIVTAVDFPQNVNVEFKKLKVERGRINHPIWSPSPFDYPTTEDVKKLIPEVSSGVEVATPSEVLNYIKGSTSTATIPSNGVLVGDLPEFEQEENPDISTLPSEGRPLGGIDTSITETEGDDKAWLM